MASFVGAECTPPIINLALTLTDENQHPNQYEKTDIVRVYI